MNFEWIAGTGGIGKGEIFRLSGNRTLGREESRSAVLTGYKDYCKAHIILSYAARLLTQEMPVYALGKVGCDERGRELKAEMNALGINTEFVCQSKLPTKYSVCFLYENGDGGNITTSNDACSEVTADFLCEALDKIVSVRGRNGLILAAPEVGLSARMDLLCYAKKLGITTVASVLSCEAEEFREKLYVKYCDVLAVNSDEITAIGSGDKEKGINILRETNKSLTLIVTAGKDGAVYYRDSVKTAIPAIQTDAVSTAGAGDAFLGGTIVGLVKDRNIKNAAQIGSVCAAFAIESPHTIPENFNKEFLIRRYQNEYNCNRCTPRRY